jgi:hypothetical protein
MRSLLFILVTGIAVIVGEPLQRTGGFGVNIGTQGSGILLQQRWTLKPSTKIGLDLRFWDIRARDEFVIYDYYTNQTYTVNEKSLVILPLFGTVDYFPFADKIVNTFAPFVTVKAGPLVSLDGDESRDRFIDRWRAMQTHVTFGGYVGVGAELLMAGGNVISLGVGWDILPMMGRVDGETHYNGVVIQFAFSRRK